MRRVSAFDISAVAKTEDIPAWAAASDVGRTRVVLLQTQAEAAGAQEISRILGRGLEARGYDIHHVFFFRRTAAFDDQPNAFFCSSQRPTGILTLVGMFIALVRHLQLVRPDAVLCFQHYGNIAGTVAARLAGIRVIVTNRTSAKSLVPKWAQWIDLMLGYAGLFKRVVVNSKAVEEEYRGYPPRYRSRVARIDHGFATKTTDVGPGEARKTLGLPADVTLLGSVARLHPGKNLVAAVRMLLLDQGWHLAVAGQGAERERLSSLARSLGISDRIHFVGELSPDQVCLFLRSLDVFVFPTLAETFGLAVVEAAQAGVPVVANDLGVLREVLAVDGKPCALFVDANDPDAFAAAVRKLLTDKDLSAALSSCGRELSQKYSLDAMVDQYAALIENELPQSTKRCPA